jgi:hypothetical protein
MLASTAEFCCSPSSTASTTVPFAPAANTDAATAARLLASAGSVPTATKLMLRFVAKEEV